MKQSNAECHKQLDLVDKILTLSQD